MKNNTNHLFQPIEDASLLDALNALGLAINNTRLYGPKHTLSEQAIQTTAKAMRHLFIHRRTVVIGAFNGTLTVDNATVQARGSSLKLIERNLIRLRITGLRISRGISNQELEQLVSLFSCKEANDFQKGIDQASLPNVKSEDTLLKAVHEGEVVANVSDVNGMGGNGVINLEDEFPDDTPEDSSPGESNIQIDQIVAFFNGDIELEDTDAGEELASDPARLGQLIMESVSIRQSVTQFSGESLGDIVLGCLRRTYDGLHEQPAFQSSEGKANLQKSLLLLEESMLDKMRAMTADPDPELDRKIVQAIRAMDETLSFEIAAQQYIEHRDALEENKKSLQEFTDEKGPDVAEKLISKTELSLKEWHKIIIEGKKSHKPSDQPSGINNLASVFGKLEKLMKSDATDDSQAKNLLSKAKGQLDEPPHTTREKLEAPSDHVTKDSVATIGGQGRDMLQEDLLSALSEVAQELMQPLTAINASMEMMLQGYVGEITTDQKEMLLVASNSGEHLRFLMNELIDIVGCPINTGIDDRFHTTSDRVAKMQDTEGQGQKQPRYFQ